MEKIYKKHTNSVTNIRQVLDHFVYMLITVQKFCKNPFISVEKYVPSVGLFFDCVKTIIINNCTLYHHIVKQFMEFRLISVCLVSGL